MLTARFVGLLRVCAVLTNICRPVKASTAAQRSLDGEAPLSLAGNKLMFMVCCRQSSPFNIWSKKNLQLDMYMPSKALYTLTILFTLGVTANAQAPGPAPAGVASVKSSPLTQSSESVCESKLGGTNVTLLMVADPGDFTGTGV